MSSYHDAAGWIVYGDSDAIYALSIRLTRLRLFEMVFPDFKVSPTVEKVQISYILPSAFETSKQNTK